ncbi:MAG: universal stress protein [Thermoleophilia bacterium]|nr:universal stress protein [Thermoleophilia bacterium]
MSPDHKTQLLICVDGSATALHAIRVAAQLHPGASSVILSAWRPAALMGYGWSPITPSFADVDDSIEQACTAAANAGVKLANELGLTARAETVRTLGSIAGAIVTRARTGDCDLIVIGTSGHSILGSAVLGSVSTAVLHHAPMPLLLIRPVDVDMREPVTAELAEVARV